MTTNQHRDKNFSWREAAVLVPTYERDGKEYVVLTVRTQALKHHSNQVAFPGGSKDETDASLWDTAVRETQEELYLMPDQIQFESELSQQLTPSGYRVTPFVARIIVPEVWTFNKAEVAEVFSVPLAHLRERKHLEIEQRNYGGQRFIDPHFFYKNHVIWGMTGRVLYEFLAL